jgi:hypothetical protein
MYFPLSTLSRNKKTYSHHMEVGWGVGPIMGADHGPDPNHGVKPCSEAVNRFVWTVFVMREHLNAEGEALKPER